MQRASEIMGYNRETFSFEDVPLFCKNYKKIKELVQQLVK